MAVLENLIWNRLVYGEFYRNKMGNSARNQPEIAEKDAYQLLEKGDYEEVYEKPGYKKAENEKRLSVEKPSVPGRKSLPVIIFIIIGLLYINWSNPLPCFRTTQNATGLTSPSVGNIGLLDSSGPSINHGGNTSQEQISLAYPFIPKASYGEPVFSSKLIDHKFSTWGEPSIHDFKPPVGIDYNKVVLTLNVSVDGVQYDRLGHLIVGGSEIWRTSTIEPGSKNVYSSFKKDVTEYVSLFQEKTRIVFKLDNVVNKRLTGVFHVHLTADFYLSEYFHSADDMKAYNSEAPALLPSNEVKINSGFSEHELYKYFEVRGAASKVISLYGNESTPLRHFPTQDLSVVLPKVAQNTTRLKLNIFASGSSSEESWYSNVLDQYTDRFERQGTVFEGHGPTRFINVWIDGEKVATQAPQPFIFTGGFSPALWRPVVPINAFDLPSIDLDISPLLPYLLDEHEHTLTILVDNGLDEVEGTTSGIGSDWIVSANLLTYESSSVKLVSGTMINSDNNLTALSFGISVPFTSTLIQNVKGIFETRIMSNIILELESGEQLNTTMASWFSGAIENVQTYKELGKKSNVVHTGTSVKSFWLAVDEDIVRLSNIRLHYFLTFTKKETPVQDGIDLNVSLVNVKILDLDVDDKPAMKESNKQEGSSKYHISDGGVNLGTGSLFTKFKSVVHGPDYGFTYKKCVKVEDNEITKEHDSFKRE